MVNPGENMMQISMDSLLGMDTICHPRINIPDTDHLDQRIMMMAGMVVNMTATNGVEALGGRIGELTSGTSTTTKVEGNCIIACHFLLIDEAEVMTEVVDSRGGVIHDRLAVIVAVDPDEIFDAAVVRQDGDGHIHEVVRGEGGGVIIRMEEIENEAARLDRGHGIEALFRRTDVAHTAITTITVINQWRSLPRTRRR